jgi:hypothetical protein
VLELKGAYFIRLALKPFLLATPFKAFVSYDPGPNYDVCPFVTIYPNKENFSLFSFPIAGTYFLLIVPVLLISAYFICALSS